MNFIDLKRCYNRIGVKLKPFRTLNLNATYYNGTFHDLILILQHGNFYLWLKEDLCIDKSVCIQYNTVEQINDLKISCNKNCITEHKNFKTNALAKLGYFCHDKIFT